MRVLALVHQYVPVRCAGAESHMHALLRALAGRGHDVDVVLSKQTGEPYTVEGVRVWPLVDQRQDPFNFLLDTDVVITHLNDARRAMVLGEWNRKPVVAVQHNTFDQTKQAYLMSSARVDLVCCNSEWMLEDLIDFYVEKHRLAPPTVIARPSPPVAEYATTPGDRVTLINMRRRDQVDGHDHLTKGGEVFRALAERMPDVEFLGVTGAYGTQQELDDLPNVEVLDHVPHDRMRDEVYARTRVLLVPSSYESWGRVAGEAMCSGIPVIASPTPGLCEQLGDVGLNHDPDDIDTWESMLRMLLNNLRLWGEYSRRASARAAELEQLAAADLEAWCDAVEQASTNITAPPLLPSEVLL